MTLSAKITSKGQITIPLAVRQIMGVKIGDILIFKPVENLNQFQIELPPRPCKLKGMFRKEAAKLKKKVSLADMDRGIRKGAAKRYERVAGIRK